jgi:phosphatidate cytidylyltransferase
MVRAFSQKDSQLSRIDFLVAGAAIFISTWFGGIEGLALSTAISIPLLLSHLLMRGPDGFVHSATSTVWILIYLPFLSGFLILLAKPENGLYQVMTFVILVGCNDTFGYLVGVLMGKHPLAPKISPKKSIEGFVGSVIFTMIGGALTFHYWLHLDWWIGVLVGLFIVFTATSGDLVESAMKRDLSLKDMGTLLPGHGGALDRLDSVLFSAPALWLALELVRNFL